MIFFFSIFLFFAVILVLKNGTLLLQLVLSRMNQLQTTVGQSNGSQQLGFLKCWSGVSSGVVACVRSSGMDFMVRRNTKWKMFFVVIALVATSGFVITINLFLKKLYKKRRKILTCFWTRFVLHWKYTLEMSDLI